VVERFETLDLKSEGSGSNFQPYSYLDLFSVVQAELLDCVVQLANWSASPS